MTSIDTRKMKSIDTLERFMEFQVQMWNRRNEEPKEPKPGPVIAIPREPGSNDEFMAQKLADELGLALYDWKIVEEIAEDAHVSEQAVAMLDENCQLDLKDWLAAFSPEPVFTSFQYLQSLRKVLFTIASHGNAVILGRGANLLLPPEMITLGLRCVAPLESRVKNVMQELHLSQENAAKHIAKTEREQRLWMKKHGFGEIHDPAHYHMIINTARVTPETIVQIVKEIIRAKS